MATVYRAIDTETGATVAIKLLDADYDASRFEREVEVLAELVHPRIVRYLAHGLATEHRAYLAMEWLEGATLPSSRRSRSRAAQQRAIAL